jgi:hypothetical protein
MYAESGIFLLGVVFKLSGALFGTFSGCVYHVEELWQELTLPGTEKP